MAPTLGHPRAAADPPDARQPPELPEEECQSLRGAVLVSSPGGLMSAYGDSMKPLECTSTRRRPMPPADDPPDDPPDEPPDDPPPAPLWARPGTPPTSGLATTGRLARLSAAPRTAPSLTEVPKPSGTVAMKSATASRPPSCQIPCNVGSSQQPVARSETPCRPVRRSTPRTTSSQEWNTVAAYGPWTSSKNVASTGPVESSRVRKITRRPERIGGVWVATLTPATSSSDVLRRSRSSF